ncbi:CDP-diacylglycerol-serine O-phosphatidyltransferase [Massospora cicadina]|nr:CDP-diacylglycerol-serine O-phosphatidyltransferase [Massospora cicadina]
MAITARRKEMHIDSKPIPNHSDQSLEKQKAILMNTQHFSLVRNFYIADFLTLMNGACGVGSVFSCLKYLADPGKELPVGETRVQYSVKSLILWPIWSLLELHRLA